MIRITRKNSASFLKLHTKTVTICDLATANATCSLNALLFVLPPTLSLLFASRKETKEIKRINGRRYVVAVMRKSRS